ncbi:MAG: EamA family transporter, partial [Raineya sp.]|nr:EamA family transporter [Raineya sp.]
MPNAELWALFCILIVHFAFAIADSLWKVPLQEISAEKGIFIRNIFTTTFLGITTFVAQKNDNFSWQEVAWAVVASFVSYWGLYFFVKAQKYLPLSLIVRILVIGAVFQFVWSVLYYREPFDWRKAVLFGFSFLASLLLTLKPNVEKSVIQRKGIIFTLLAAFFWTSSGAFSKEFAHQLGAARFGFILELTILCTSGVLLLLQKNLHKVFIISSQSFGFLVLIAFFGAIGVYFSHLSLIMVSLSSLLIIRVIADIIPIAT